ncbi:MAG: SIR2 family protein [Rhizobiaceae bacterium]
MNALESGLRSITGSTDLDRGFKELAELAILEDSKSVRDLLRDLFRCKTPTNSQAEILKYQWKRIYTVNYDDCVEKCLRASLSQNFNLLDPVPKRILYRSLIHLHGYIGSIENEKLDECIVLNDRSYAKLMIQRSPWLLQLQSDIRFSRNVIFIGFSNRDHHIQSILLSDPDIKSKSTFIIGPDSDEMDIKLLSAYGDVYPIGIDAAKIEIEFAVNTNEEQPDLHKLKNFRISEP